MKIKSYLINLDHRKDRLEEFISNHTQFGFNKMSFNRISAIYDKDFGGLGCAKSHLIALCDFMVSSDFTHCLIVEDDFRFRFDVNFFENTMTKILNHQNNFNVFLLAGSNVVSVPSAEFCEIFESQSTSGYLVSRNYVRKLIDNFSRSIYLMEKFKNLENRRLIYNRFSIDQTWKYLQQEGDWYSVIPMIGYQQESFSDIEGVNVNYSTISS